MLRILIALLCAGPMASSLAQSESRCAALGGLKLENTQSVFAETVRGPTFKAPSVSSNLPSVELLTELPAFCRVSGVIAPAIRFEVWLPLEDWNGKFQGTGNGGYNGSILYNALADGVRRRYATSSTDMGHAATSPDPGSWALGHPELVVDQGYRAQHETAIRSKQIIRAFYGRAPRRSYFTGCSSGGWQGLTEAQRFPRDYDGIVAGAPAINVVHLHAATLWNQKALGNIATTKFRMVTDAVLARCDAKDGVQDGLITNPLACDFSPRELACKTGSSTANCLTPEEVSAFGMIQDGLRYSSGDPIYPGWPRGLEYAFEGLANSELLTAIGATTFKNLAFHDPNWDYRRIDFDRDVRRADAAIGSIVNSNSPDLRDFRKAGGKLILYHGWNDAFISPLQTLDYYKRVAMFVSEPGSSEDGAIENLQDFARLFLAPGVHHCSEGPGPDTFDALAELEKWVERDVAPDRIVAAHVTNGVINRTRPLCPYPQVAVYRGHGSTDQAESFACR